MTVHRTTTKKRNWVFPYMELHSCSDSSSCSPSSVLSNSRPEARDSEGSVQKEKQMFSKNPIKFKGFLDNKIQRGFLHQTLEAGPSAPGAPSSFWRPCWALFLCTDRQGPLWPEAERSALPQWWLARLEAGQNEGTIVKAELKHQGGKRI